MQKQLQGGEKQLFLFGEPSEFVHFLPQAKEKIAIFSASMQMHTTVTSKDHATKKIIQMCQNGRLEVETVR